MEEKKIIQLIPCAVPMYNIYKNDDGSYFHERVCCIALCADDIIRSIAGGEYFDFAEDACNFVGCYGEESLAEYPTSAN